MSWINAVPFVGTGVGILGCVECAVQGNCGGLVCKIGEVVVSGSFDALTVCSGGLSEIVQAPVKTVVKEAAKASARTATTALLGGAIAVAGTAAAMVGCAVAEEVADFFKPGSGSWKYCGIGESGGGQGSTQSSGNQGTGTNSGNNEANTVGGRGDQPNDPPRWNPSPSNVREDEIQQFVDEPGNPIRSYTTGRGGRVQSLSAEIRPENLRDGPRRSYTAEVRRFVHSLDFGPRDSVGHIIADSLGGPTNRTYNYFPMHTRANQQYYQYIERKIKEFLERERARGRTNANVRINIELIYPGDSTRPDSVEFFAFFSDNTIFSVVFNNYETT